MRKFLLGVCVAVATVALGIGSVYAQSGKHCPEGAPFVCKEGLSEFLEGLLTPIQNSVSALEGRVGTVESAIVALQQQQSKVVVFSENRPQPFTTDPIDTSGGFNKMTVTVGTTGHIAGYSLLVQSGGSWIEQVRIRCDGGQECPIVTVPVISDQYRFSTGSASGNITATALLEK